MNLKKIRIEKQFTQQDVANALNITQQAYANYESEKRHPNPDTLIQLSAFFGVTVDSLLGIENVPISEIDAIFQELTPSNQETLLELARMYRDLQTK